jgi:hypothetical protein
VGELGFPELTAEQVELLCQTAEHAARKHILNQVLDKDITRLDITVEVEGTKPVNITVEVDLLLSKQVKTIAVETLVKEAVNSAHIASENFLRNIQ